MAGLIAPRKLPMWGVPVGFIPVNETFFIEATIVIRLFSVQPCVLYSLVSECVVGIDFRRFVSRNETRKHREQRSFQQLPKTKFKILREGSHMVSYLFA